MPGPESTATLQAAFAELDDPRDRFLARVLARAFGGSWRISEDFLDDFGPTDIVQTLRDDAELRNQLLVETVGLHPKIAELKSAESAAEDVRLAFEAGVADARTILALVPLSKRIQHLDRSRLWRFATEGDWLEHEGDGEHEHHRALERILFIIHSAIAEELIGARQVLGALDPETLAEHLPVAELRKAFAYALACAHRHDEVDEERLLGSVDLDAIIQAAPLKVLWQRVVIELIAGPQGLLGDVPRRSLESVVDSGWESRPPGAVEPKPVEPPVRSGARPIDESEPDVRDTDPPPPPDTEADDGSLDASPTPADEPAPPPPIEVDSAPPVSRKRSTEITVPEARLPSSPPPPPVSSDPAEHTYADSFDAYDDKTIATRKKDIEDDESDDDIDEDEETASTESDPPSPSMLEPTRPRATPPPAPRASPPSVPPPGQPPRSVPPPAAKPSARTSPISAPPPPAPPKASAPPPPGSPPKPSAPPPPPRSSAPARSNVPPPPRRSSAPPPGREDPSSPLAALRSVPVPPPPPAQGARQYPPVRNDRPTTRGLSAPPAPAARPPVAPPVARPRPPEPAPVGRRRGSIPSLTDEATLELSESEIAVEDYAPAPAAPPPQSQPSHTAFPLQAPAAPRVPHPSPSAPSEADRRREIAERLNQIGRLPPNSDYLSLAILKAIASMYEHIKTRKGKGGRAQAIRESFANDSHLRAAMLALLDLLNPNLARENPGFHNSSNDALVDLLLDQEKRLWEQSRRGGGGGGLPARRAVHVPPSRPPRSMG